METLFEVEPKLTERQQAAVEFVAEHQPVRARELGLFLHERKGCRFCVSGVGCRYAQSEGLSVLKALKAKGVLRLRRNGWFVARPEQSSQGELPAGF